MKKSIDPTIIQYLEEGIAYHARCTKDIAEEMGFTVLHGIVDCLWVQGPGVEVLKQQVESEISILTEVEHFNWIVFIPQADGSGAYNRYFGRLRDGSIKVRGIAARRHDTPELIRAMQGAMLEIMAGAENIAELNAKKEKVMTIFKKAAKDLVGSDPKALVIHRGISRLTYAHRCLEGSAVQAYRDRGIIIAPGMKIGYIVRDAQDDGGEHMRFLQRAGFYHRPQERSSIKRL